VAVVAHVAVGNDGEVTIPRLDMAIDCGLVVNPDRVRAQLEGAAIMSIGNALYSHITVKNGSVEQSNYTDYLVSRIDITPETHVYFAENTHLPSGVGEPGVPPYRARHLQRDLCGNRQTDQGTAGRPAAVEGLKRRSKCDGVSDLVRKSRVQLGSGCWFVPDSKLAREVTELVRDTESALLFQHSSRVYYWGALTGKRRGLRFDPELL